MNNYIMGTKRTGLPKNNMIDFIAGVFTNEASKYTCLKYVSKYFDEKTTESIVNERRLRRLLHNSTEKVVRNIYELCWQDYKHLAQYREDNLQPKRSNVVASADGHRYADGDTTGGRNVFMTFEQFTLKEDYDKFDIPMDKVLTVSDDIYKKLLDIEGEIKCHIDSDVDMEIELQESLMACRRFINRAIFVINENATFERSQKMFEKKSQEETFNKIESIIADLEKVKRDENQEKCLKLLKKSLNCLK